MTECEQQTMMNTPWLVHVAPLLAGKNTSFLNGGNLKTLYFPPSDSRDESVESVDVFVSQPNFFVANEQAEQLYSYLIIAMQTKNENNYNN